MYSYPITVARKSYRGSDPRKRAKINHWNAVAARVESHLNADLALKPDDTVNVYSSYTVAADLGEDADLVQEIIYATDCGAGGITILKGDWDRAIAK